MTADTTGSVVPPDAVSEDMALIEINQKLGAMAELFQALFERLEAINTKLDKGVSASAGSSSNDGATPRKKNSRGDWVFDVTGLSSATDDKTGEDGFWARSKKGNWLLVDVQGYPMFNEERPLANEETAV